MNIPILFEDDWLLIVDKPAGLLTIPTPRRESRTLTSILNDDAVERGCTYRLHPCHRLDRETSGLIVYAKGKSAQAKMMELFRLRQVQKTYLAFVHGAPAQTAGTVKNPIAGERAETRYKVVEKRKDFAIVEVTPVTGRTNQIRIHFKHLRHPLVGETTYAFRRDFALRAKRLCLHAQQLAFRHPVTGHPLAVAAPLPEDLKGFLAAHP